MSSDSGPGRTIRSDGEEHREGPPDAPRSGQGSPVQSDAPRGFERCNVLLLSFLSFCVIVFGVWVVSAGKRYREEYAQATPSWHVGSTRTVEVTVVTEDRLNLACAADSEIAGLRCGYRRDSQEAGPFDPQTLQPYNTVGNELLLGSGLWSSLDAEQSLPQSRFTVVCTYNIKGVMKSARIRFHQTAPFSPLRKTVTVGTLTDCKIPQ